MSDQVTTSVTAEKLQELGFTYRAGRFTVGITPGVRLRLTRVRTGKLYASIADHRNVHLSFLPGYLRDTETLVALLDVLKRMTRGK